MRVADILLASSFACLPSYERSKLNIKCHHTQQAILRRYAKQPDCTGLPTARKDQALAPALLACGRVSPFPRHCSGLKAVSRTRKIAVNRVTIPAAVIQ